MVRIFVDRLRAAGINPDEVITDDSRLYPSVLADVWPRVCTSCRLSSSPKLLGSVLSIVPTLPPDQRMVAHAIGLACASCV